eukprot:c11004_g1_i1.p1 GENE.c11004_g1_i1~~c11004_g1_i1.p1  ORF type:complete len:159 (+),score=52.31 c11004_g1_i1:47-478(+)
MSASKLLAWNFELQKAAQSGDAVTVTHLLSLGADVNFSEGNQNPLFLASLEGEIEVVKILVSAGASIETVGELVFGIEWGQYFITGRGTPLWIAASKGNVEVVKYLLNCGAKIDAKGMDDLTPIEIARKNGHQDVVEVLAQSN